MSTQGAASVRMNRWVILAGYALLTASTQLLWLAYAPITTQTHKIMGVSQGAVGDLAVIFPLMYVVLALPAGRWLDVSFARALGLGAVLTAGGGLLRLAGLPVVLDWSELHAGPERAGAAAGFLLLAGNLGGVILALLVQAVVGNPYLSLGALSVVCLAGLAVATRLPAHGPATTPEAATAEGAAQ